MENHHEPDLNLPHRRRVCDDRWLAGKDAGMTHTPGPWFAEKVGNDYRIVYGEGNWLAEVLSDGWPDEVASADAHLIAAAPDLLEALKVLVSEEWSEMDDDDLAYEASQGNKMVISYISARAAIAKAEGRT